MNNKSKSTPSPAFRRMLVNDSCCHMIAFFANESFSHCLDSAAKVSKSPHTAKHFPRNLSEKRPIPFLVQKILLLL